MLLRGIANRNTRSLNWPMIGQKVPVMVWIQSQLELENCNVLSDHLNYNLLKGYYGIFTQWHQNYTAYLSFNLITLITLCHLQRFVGVISAFNDEVVKKGCNVFYIFVTVWSWTRTLFSLSGSWKWIILSCGLVLLFLIPLAVWLVRLYGSVPASITRNL